MAQISIELVGNKVNVTGELTFKTVMQVLQKGENYVTSMPKLMIDFANVTKVDSSALALLMAWVRKAKSYSNNIEIINTPDKLLALANTCGVKEIIPYK